MQLDDPDHAKLPGVSVTDEEQQLGQQADVCAGL
jgi:hypothetical protein